MHHAVAVARAVAHHRAVTKRLAAVAICLWLAAPDAAWAQASWATTQAAELTRQGKEHADRGDVDVASRRFMEAITLDGTYGPAYLALGAVREASGDPAEGERAYSLGIEHVPGFAEGLAARARLRARQRRLADALGDFEAAAKLRPDDLALLPELANAYVAVQALPAALAVARRIEALLADGDPRALADARLRSRALGALVGELDPVIAGATGRGSVRRALAAVAGAGTRGPPAQGARPAPRGPAH